MADITGLTGFSYFRKMMSYVFRGTMMSLKQALFVKVIKFVYD